MFIKDLPCKIDNERAFRFWISLYKKEAKIKSIELKNSWNDYFKNLFDDSEQGRLEIKQSEISIDDVETILQTVKNKIFDLRLDGNILWDANRISKALENFLDGNDSLLNLSIPNMGLESANLDCILSKIPSCRNLKSLDLSNNCLGPEAVQQLANVLKNNTIFIERLNISRNNLRPEGIRLISEALEINRTIEDLNISNNNLGPEGIEKICKALETNETVNKLYILNTNLGPEGIRHICELLKTKKTIKTLNISSNNLGSEGIRLVCEVLETNETLKYLTISNNEYDSASAERLYRALKKNVGLRYLKISKKDKIYTEFGERLEKMLRRKGLILLFDESSYLIQR